ncbi:hypothetical protein H4R20_005300 [Coemansia guatemalensis]|uniref:Uncharacterized protein n=1 Tax=Coemansia guatemalensis TaxID=2761395 RepID=A0A9W8HRZ5_9FUNG|nr:hypothetical protein H4R20_005300 [Coemansia guatemalensis]
MNKIPRDTLHSAGSSSRIETVSRAAGSVAPVSRELAGRDLASASHHPDITGGGSGGGQRAQENTLSMAAVTPAPWYSQVNEVDGGAALSQDLSRYPGMPTSNASQHVQAQAAGRPSGRSNRNSIQYNVSAPRELISQEAGISVPETISESDFDDDSDGRISANGDPMMRLNRYDSSNMLQSNSAFSRS